MSDGQRPGILRSFSWNLMGQVVGAATSLAVVPAVIVALGLDQFGVYSLAMTGVALLAQLDGGLAGTAMRYLAISYSDDDTDRATRQWLTILLMVSAIGVGVGAVVALAAGPLVDAFDIPIRLRPDAVSMAHAVAVLVPLGLVFAVFQSALQARAQFRLVSVVTIVVSLVRSLGVLACSLAAHHPLRLIALVVVASQVLALVLVAPAALRHLHLRHPRLVSRDEAREIAGYSAKVQLFSLSYLVNTQSDAFVIGLVAPISVVGMYSAGANIALQLRGVFSNAIYPMGVSLADSFGRSGRAGARRAFEQMQQTWVGVTSIVCAALVPASLFMIEAWLGARFWRAAVIGVVLLAGYSVNLLTAPLTLYCHGVGEPGVEARYGLASMALNVVLTAALVVFGAFGVVAATAAGTVVGSLLLVRIARRRVEPDIPAFARSIPWLPCAAAAAVAAALGWGIEPHGPHGIAGVIVSGAYVAPAAAAGLGAHFGVRAAFSSGRRLVGAAPRSA